MISSRFAWAYRLSETRNAILAFFVLLGLVYLIPKVLTFNPGAKDYFDFEPMWAAGKAWASGHNPYVVEGARSPPGIGTTPPISIWFYPPYWYPIIVPFGLLPFPIGLTIWKAINFSLLVGGTYLVARALADSSRQHFLPLFLAGMAFASFMYATAVTAWSGQTSFLVYFGLAALIFGLLRARPSLLVIGLAFLALKPQIGALAFLAVAALHRYRWTTIVAGIVCLLATAAIPLTADYRASIEGFIANLPRHAEHAANAPPHLTGIVHLLEYISPIAASPLATPIIFLIAAGILVSVFYRSPLQDKPEENPAAAIPYLAFFVSFCLFIVPFHYYDMVALTFLPMMLMAGPLAGRALILGGLLLCYRPDFIVRALGSKPEEILVSHFVSPGLLLILVGCIWSLVKAQPAVNRDQKLSHGRSR